MAKLQYNHPDDNLAPLATLSLPMGVAVAAFPLANLVNLNPANPFKLTGTSCRVVFDHGSAMAVNVVALFHHNLDADLDVRFQANATDSWGAPSFSQALTIGAKDKDGYRPNTYYDLSGAPPTYRYNSLYVAGTNSLAIILGGIWIGSALRTVTHNYSWGFKRDDVRPGRRILQTVAGVEWVNPSLGRRRRLTGEVLTSDAGLATLSTFSQACGGVDQPALVIPNAPDISDAMLAKWAVDFGYAGDFKDNDVMPVGWIEVARGGPWP